VIDMAIEPRPGAAQLAAVGSGSRGNLTVEGDDLLRLDQRPIRQTRGPAAEASRRDRTTAPATTPDAGIALKTTP